MKMKLQKQRSNLLLIGMITLSMLIEMTSTEKILAVTLFGSKSNKITFMPLLKELAHRGHQVTLITIAKEPKDIKNLREIVPYDVSEIFSKSFSPFEAKESGKFFNGFIWLKEVFPEFCARWYDNPEIKALFNETFDLVFTQSMFNECALGLVHKTKAPIVNFSPISVPDFVASRSGGHFPASFVSNTFKGFWDEMTFQERFVNFGVNLALETYLRFIYEPVMEAVYREKLGSDVPSVREILANVSLILSNGHFSMSRPKPYLPNVVDIGGIHSGPAKPLPKDLEDFVTKSGKDGFIYFSLGSAVPASTMPETKRKMFVKVFSKLKQQVVWKWESETMPDLPKNVKLSKWLPQQDLLGHPNIKLFITHVGGGSLEESIYHGVPLVGIPLFGDQPLNSKQAQNHGFLIEVDWNHLTEETLTNAINEMLNNPKYQDNVNRLSAIFKDQIDDPLERAVYWMEYVMRHKGAPHLRSAARNLNYFQYHSLDVIALYLVMTLVLLKLTVSFLGFIIKSGARKFTKSNSKSNEDIKKKKK